MRSNGISTDLWKIEEVGEDRTDLGQCRRADIGGLIEAFNDARSADDCAEMDLRHAQNVAVRDVNVDLGWETARHVARDRYDMKCGRVRGEDEVGGDHDAGSSESRLTALRYPEVNPNYVTRSHDGLPSRSTRQATDCPLAESGWLTRCQCGADARPGRVVESLRQELRDRLRQVLGRHLVCLARRESK